MFLIWSQELCTCSVDCLRLELDRGGGDSRHYAQCTSICKFFSCSVHEGRGCWGWTKGATRI